MRSSRRAGGGACRVSAPALACALPLQPFKPFLPFSTTCLVPQQVGHLAAQLGLTNSLAPPSPPAQQSLTELQVGAA